MIALHPTWRPVAATSHAPRIPRNPRCFFVGRTPCRAKVQMRRPLPIYGRPVLRVAPADEWRVYVDGPGQLPSMVVREGRRWHTPGGVWARKYEAIADVLVTDLDWGGAPIDRERALCWARQGWIPVALGEVTFVAQCTAEVHRPSERWCDECVQLWRLAGRRLGWRR